MNLIDGEGKPIPDGSWGGDLDPMRSSSCRECGVQIPFGKFCPQHLNAARQKNEQIMARRRAAQGIDEQAAQAAGGLVKSEAAEPAIEREVDMDLLAAAEQARASAIVTPGKGVPPAVDHMAPFSGTPKTPVPTPAPKAPAAAPAPSNLAAQGKVESPRNSDAFMADQGLVWVSTLRMMAEEGSLPADKRNDVLRAAAELIYALA